MTTADGLADNLVRALYDDHAGNLWIATDGGVSRRSADGRLTNFLTSGVGSVLCFAEEPTGAGDLFVGTDSGLQRFHTTADGEVKITTYTTRDGLFDNAMWCLLDDGRGNLWTSSNKGIARLAWADLERFDRKNHRRHPPRRLRGTGRPALARGQRRAPASGVARPDGRAVVCHGEGAPSAWTPRWRSWLTPRPRPCGWRP